MPLYIDIVYDSSWRNSFLDGSNNQPLPKQGRKFIGSMTELKKSGNFIARKIEHDTVMGVLNRLIGDQRKLYQARNDPKYYFNNLEGQVKFDDKLDIISSEMTYIRNISGSEDQNSFTGMINVRDPVFKSDYSRQLWGVLELDFNELLNFIIDENYVVDPPINCDPLSVIEQLELLNKLKAIDYIDVEEAIIFLQKKFDNVPYVSDKSKVLPISLYCSALYLQLERLKQQYDLSSALTKLGGLSGISKRGFTKKDFMVRYTSGDKKKIFGNPYLLKERIKGEGEVTSIMKKACGKLKIELNISSLQANELMNMIENAGVSSFYMGKKGLAYVENIHFREAVI